MLYVLVHSSYLSLYAVHVRVRAHVFLATVYVDVQCAEAAGRVILHIVGEGDGFRLHSVQTSLTRHHTKLDLCLHSSS